MRFGFGILRLAPDAFWQLTPRELAAASAAWRAPSPAGAPTRAGLDALLRTFPDRAEVQ